MKMVYVAGPYRSPTEHGVVDNIRRAEALALKVWKAGAACICPHKNTALFGGALGMPDSVWLEGDLEMVKRCDAVICVENWRDSRGATDEVAFALQHRIPILESIEQLERWLNAKEISR